MDRSEVTPTLLHALLSNQAAIVVALADIAEWIEGAGSVDAANLVRSRLTSIGASQAIIGACVGALMQPR